MTSVLLDIWEQVLPPFIGCFEKDWVYSDKELQLEDFTAHMYENQLHLDILVDDSTINITENIMFNDSYYNIPIKYYYVITSLCAFGQTVNIIDNENGYICSEQSMSGTEFTCQHQCGVEQYVLTRYCFYFGCVCVCVCVCVFVGEMAVAVGVGVGEWCGYE